LIEGIVFLNSESDESITLINKSLNKIARNYSMAIYTIK
jgi:hypothetical protein